LKKTRYEKVKIVVLGGTHGNEFTGVEVINNLKSNPVNDAVHDYELIFSSPKSYENKSRYIDYDLNRSFGTDGKAFGYEKTRAEEIRNQVSDKFDFLIDLHTTTSNMGLTVILNYKNDLTLNAACFLKSKFPDLKIIMGSEDGSRSPFIGSLCSAGLTIEVGPIANNLVKADLVFTCQQMVEELLRWDFEEDFMESEIEVFQTTESYYYPEGNWYLHPNFDGKDFEELSPGTPIFINTDKEEKSFESEKSTYPFFINEAAYFDAKIAFSTSTKTTIGELKSTR
jgi:aspartoacylase